MRRRRAAPAHLDRTGGGHGAPGPLRTGQRSASPFAWPRDAVIRGVEAPRSPAKGCLGAEPGASARRTSRDKDPFVRIVIVGTGISGLAAAWLLGPFHEVHVLERASRLGGHTNTVAAPRPDGSTVPVDTGFIVYNEPTYPLLTRLFDELDVATRPSDMSWSLRCERCDLEYAGTPTGMVAQPSNLAAPGYWRLLSDILRFNAIGRRLVDDPRATELSLGRFLAAAGFSDSFARHYLLPMAGAIWSSGTAVIDRFPLQTLLTFFDNHGLLGVTSHHPWRTVVGGSSTYIPKLTARFEGRVHRGREVAALSRDADGVTVRLDDGTATRFDAAVVATHADEALGLLADPSRQEKDLLGAWTYSHNDTYLHTDRALLPERHAAWASWNYRLDDCRVPTERVSLSYHMNRLQGLDEPEEYVVTLNPSTPPSPERTLQRLSYAHPSYTPEAVASQAKLDQLNGRQRTFFTGAYQRYGFHEDGLWSAVRAVSHLGVRWPV